MSIVFAASVPHNPVLLPAIGKDHAKLFSPTIKSLEKLADKVKELDLDSLIIISPHAPKLKNAFGINLNKDFTGRFKQFGDLVTTVECHGDIELAYQTKEYIETNLPVQIYSEEELDYGTSVPLFYFLNKKTDLKIIPLSISELDLSNHFQFGNLIRKKADLSTKKVGIISSLHLSHRHDDSNPHGYHPDGKKFDNEIKQGLKKKELDKLIELPQELISNAQSCGYPALLTLLGTISEINYTTDILSYETVLGIGHLTVEFVI